MTDAGLLGHMTARWRSLDALLDHLAERPGSSFILPFDAPADGLGRLRIAYPDYLDATLDAADAACHGTLNLLGHVARLEREIEWNREPITGWRWPALARRRMERYLYAGEMPADPILVWEMNRQQHLALLGIAYWTTGETRYAETAASHIRSWIAANPVGHGINWYYALEVAVRLLAWSAAFQFFRHSDAFRGHAGASFLKSLYQQAHFVSTHLQTTRSTTLNNHLMAEATALVVVGAIFPEFRQAAAWRETGLQLLAEQALAQTHSDGVNKEQATCYHRFVAELLLLSVVLGRRGLLPQLHVLEETLERMIGYVGASLTPAGGAPLWGDSDYARALGLAGANDYWDFRHLLAMGAALFQRSDWKFLAGHFPAEAYLQLGEAGLAAWEQLEARPPAQTSYAFSDAGIYVIRDSWEADADVGFFRCGPFGLGGAGHCSHAHCDLLSPLLWIKGRELLVDSGTYLYSGPWRDRFRLSGAHNTLLVDGREQATPLRYFGWQDAPAAQAEAWDGQRIAGVLTAAPGVRLRRELRHTTAGVWEISDHVQGPGSHRLGWSFHFAPGLMLRVGEGRVIVTSGAQPFVVVSAPAGVALEVGNGWSAPTYARKEPHATLLATWEGDTTAGAAFHWRFAHLIEEKLVCE